MTEIWKDIEGYEKLYQVSNIGRVRSKDGIRHVGNGYYGKRKGRILKPFKLKSHGDDSNYYWQVTLYDNGSHRKFTIHRLVATAFVKNNNNLPCVNHIDGNKLNNHADNLEWCSFSENNQHAYDNGLTHAPHLSSERAKAMRSKVDNSKFYRKVVDITTGKEYKSISSTKEDGFRPNNVQLVCSGKAKTHYGHVFAYV